MPHIETFIPGQISLSNVAPAVPAGDKYYAGQGTKIEVYQMNYAMTASHVHMPNPYLPNSTSSTHVDSIFGELDREEWLKFILLEIEWGKIETSPGVFNWTFLDFVFNTIRTLPKATGQNKKVMLLMNFRNPGSLVGLEGLLPLDLLTQPAANGGYYKNTTSFPPSSIDPIVNAKKYDNLWCYEAADPNAGGVVAPRGYNLNLYKFTTAAGTNTLKTRFYAFLQAIYDRYGNDAVFGGIMTTESAIGAPFVAYESGNSRDLNYQGRLNILKQMRSVFAGHLMAETCTFDTKYYQDMTNAGVTDGLIVNRIGFSPANMHTGTNLLLGNIIPVLKGKVPVFMQAQPLDQWTMTGNRPNYYNWPANPTQILGGDGINYNDPPTAQRIFDRFVYFGATHSVFQRNYSLTATGSTNTNIQNWPKWKIFMRASAYANDPLGGMSGVRPQFPF